MAAPSAVVVAVGEAMHTPLAGLSVLPLRAITGLNSGDGDGAGGGRIGKGDEANGGGGSCASGHDLSRPLVEPTFSQCHRRPGKLHSESISPQ